MPLIGKNIRGPRGYGDNSNNEHSELWLVSYADMMTLLFGFFVILYAISVVDDKKLSDMGKKIAEAFKADIEKTESEQQIMMEARQIRALQMLVAMLNLGDNVEAVVESVEKSMTRAQNLEMARQNLMKDLQIDDSLVRELQISVSNKLDQIEIALPDTMLFESGTADLTKRARTGLGKIATYLNRIEGLAAIEIVGHTDSLPPSRTSKYPSNWGLSSARAGAVAEELLKNGLDAKSLATRGMASLQPLFPERRRDGVLMKENLPKNRRVSILVKKRSYGSLQ